MQRDWKVQEGTLQNPRSSALGAAFLASSAAPVRYQTPARGRLGAVRGEGHRGNGRGITGMQNAPILTTPGRVTMAVALVNTARPSGSGLCFVIHKEKVEFWFNFCHPPSPPIQGDGS